MQSPTHLTIVSSAGFGVWDEEHNAERYIKEGAVDKLICGHFGAMLSTKKLVLEDRFEAYNLPLGMYFPRNPCTGQGASRSSFQSRSGYFVDPREKDLELTEFLLMTHW